MTYDEFIATYNGQYKDYDGRYGYQCVDLAKLYLDKVFGIIPEGWGDARFYYENFEKHSELVNNFTKMPMKVLPEKGDLVVWGRGQSESGHIALATGRSTSSRFASYDQNWPHGSPIHLIKDHKYDNVIGLLRPKDRTNIGNLNVTITPAGSTVEEETGTTYNVTTSKYGSLFDTEVEKEDATLREVAYVNINKNTFTVSETDVRLAVINYGSELSELFDEAAAGITTTQTFGDDAVVDTSTVTPNNWKTGY